MRQQDIASLVVAEIGDRIAIVTERDLTARAIGMLSIRDVLGILVQATAPETMLVMLQQAALT